MQNDNLCPCCGAKLTGRWENISKGLTFSLIKFRRKVLEKRENKIHLSKDLELSNYEYNNFQKLRYHGLIAHYKDPVTKEYVSGYWLLTKRGNEFLKHKISIPKGVLIFRNAIQERSDVRISLQELMKEDTPYWYAKDDYEIVFMNISDYENIDSDFDENGQGKLF